MYGLAVDAVALVVVRLGDRGVDRNLVEVGSAEPQQLGVEVRMDSAREKRIVGKIDPRHQVLDAERDLLGLGEEVVGIAVEHHPAHRLTGDKLLRDDLGGIEHVEGERRSPGPP